jgi:enoyl-CoA hydratase/carnithine racemase
MFWRQYADTAAADIRIAAPMMPDGDYELKWGLVPDMGSIMARSGARRCCANRSGTNQRI